MVTNMNHRTKFANAILREEFVDYNGFELFCNGFGGYCLQFRV